MGRREHERHRHAREVSEADHRERPAKHREIAASSYERQVSELVDADEETATYVASLEERHDEDPGTVPSAETIAEEVERFLREQ